MFIITQELFEKLDPDAQKLVQDDGTSIDDPKVEEQIEKLAGINDEAQEGAETPDEGNYEPVPYGQDNQMTAHMNEEGHMKDLSETDKAGIHSLDDAGDRGHALLIALGEKKPKSKIEKIPEKKNLDNVKADTQAKQDFINY